MCNLLGVKITFNEVEFIFWTELGPDGSTQNVD